MAESFNIYKNPIIPNQTPVVTDLPSWTPIERPYILEKPLSSNSNGYDDSAKIAYMLNEYRNSGYFGAYCQPIQDTAEGAKPGEEKEIENPSINSLFNPICAVGYNQFMQVRQNAPLLDFPDMRKRMQSTSDCSIKALVEATKNNELGKETFKYSDFMYCTYLGRVSNNYMITLRRFGRPCADHINYTNPFSKEHQEGKMDTEKHDYDVGRMITWLGTPGNDISNILKYNVKMPYKALTSDFQNTGGGGGDSGGLMGAFLNATTNPTFQTQMIQGQAGASVYGYLAGMKKTEGTSFFSNVSVNPSSGGVDPNKVYGPIDVIRTTHVRDQGLFFTHEFELTFDYQLRSYDGINPRAAMHDLIGNILAVTYASGPFWKGAFRGSGPSQSNIFANLPIYKLNSGSSISDVVGAFLDSGKAIISGLGGNTGNPVESLGNIISTIGKGLFSAILGAGLDKLGRPAKGAIASLLSPAPVGLWHVTIGNPWHPIMSMGNMILDGTDIEHYGPLGLDDFPTGLRVKVKLKHAKGRDATGIEQMYMQGEDRIYTPMNKEMEKLLHTSSFDSSKRGRKKGKRYDSFGKDLDYIINGKNGTTKQRLLEVGNKRYNEHGAPVVNQIQTAYKETTHGVIAIDNSLTTFVSKMLEGV